MANLYDLKKFDLNLLVIFECIYQHLSISKKGIPKLTGLFIF